MVGPSNWLAHRDVQGHFEAVGGVARGVWEVKSMRQGPTMTNTWLRSRSEVSITSCGNVQCVGASLARMREQDAALEMAALGGNVGFPGKQWDGFPLFWMSKSPMNV